MPKRIAVILTVHNRKEQTLKCVEQLCRETLPLDIFVTDDGCTDGTTQSIKELFPKVHIQKGDGALFWNRGMHLSFKEAMSIGYDYYLWVNDDTEFVRGFCSKLYDYSSINGDNAILCGACIDNEKNKNVTYGGYVKGWRILSLSDKPQECLFASGNILFIPNKIANKLGNVDYYYRHSMGDFDYESRARRHGFKIIQMPQYLGICSRHPKIPIWRDTSYSLKTRIKDLYSPLGQNPLELFHFEKKNTGIPRALIRSILVHIRCAFPKLWGSKYYVKA